MNDEMKYKELVSRYVDDEVTSQEKNFVEQLLKEDKSLYAYYQDLLNLDRLLTERPVEDISKDWERKVQTSLDEVDLKEVVTMKKKSKFKESITGGVVVTLLIVGLISLQTYTKRGIQGRFRGVARYKVSSDDIGEQYSPGNISYLSSNYSATQTPSGVAYIGEEGLLQQSNTEEYARIYENKFLAVSDNPLSTFSIDVDTGSYSNIRRFLNQGQLPPADAVRIEEMINYFSYNYPNPIGEDPFSINIDAAICPWNKDHQLVRIGLQGKTLAQEEILPSNLVFLIDVSGSMDESNKLPLLKKSLKMMVNHLSEDQRMAIIVYADAARKVLDSTPGSHKRKILNVIDSLSAGGSTAGGAGIKLAYRIAKENLIEGGNNRVILATDGDFNTGVSSTSEMIRLIEEKKEEGIFLTVLGFGTGNYKDHRLEQIANKGNGTYHYIDTKLEANKILVEELGSTLFTIAKDVKLQIEFNSSQVKAYRLIGYENRVLNKEDFNDDTRDAGELGAGHTVTALYEIVPAGSDEEFGSIDELAYQKSQRIPSSDLMTVKLRYKDPDQDISKLIKQVINQQEVSREPQGDFQFVAAVAEFGLLLRNSKFKANSNYNHVIQSAEESKGKDASGYRQEFIDLVNKANSLDYRLSSDDLDGTGEETQGILRFKNDASNE